MAKYAIGLDYGTLSVRALLVDVTTGEEVATALYEYPHKVMETHIPSGKKLPVGWALQHPTDYIEGLEYVIKDVIRQKHLLPEEVVGIGIDFTSSTVMAVKSDGTPLCLLDAYKDEPHSYVKLWKHHGGEEEAALIDQVIHERGEKWIDLYGGKVSSEWMIPKVYETLRHAEDVYNDTDYFLEAMDWVVWMLTGKQTRSACGAGYKAFYRHDSEYPSKDFFKAIDPRLENLVEEKLNAPILPLGTVAGELTEEMARKLGLNKGTPVATAIIDAHASLIGSGIGDPNTMMIIVGTSSCHMLLSEKEAGIAGVGGLVKDGILPNYFAYEAGQCCVGDHFAWFTDHYIPESNTLEAKVQNISIHELLVNKLKDYKAGASGLVALDWWNGVRSPLMDFNLNGMIVGMNLLTKPEEIYLSLIEATAYGTRMIVESFEEAGVQVDSLVLGGGIPAKNRMLVQVYADICNKPIKLSGTTQASGLGAAILGAAANPNETGFRDANEAAKALGKQGDEVFMPNNENVEVYDRLYAEYKTLHHYFGKENNVMKRLNALREERK